MHFLKVDIPDIYILEPHVFDDQRGWLFESWSLRELQDHDLYYNFVQDNHSFSARRDTLRGLHFQKGKASQAKFVRCIRGAVLDVAVDLRKDSPAYKRWIAIELSAKNKHEMLIPRGFAHGFLTLTDNVEILYKADNFYNPTAEGSILWNDPDLAIDWHGVQNPIIAAKDTIAPRLKHIEDSLDFYCREQTES